MENCVYLLTPTHNTCNCLWQQTPLSSPCGGQGPVSPHLCIVECLPLNEKKEYILCTYVCCNMVHLEWNNSLTALQKESTLSTFSSCSLKTCMQPRPSMSDTTHARTQHLSPFYNIATIKSYMNTSMLSVLTHTNAYLSPTLYQIVSFLGCLPPQSLWCRLSTRTLWCSFSSNSDAGTGSSV